MHQQETVFADSRVKQPMVDTPEVAAGDLNHFPCFLCHYIQYHQNNQESPSYLNYS
jgi:hypothetical protein